MAEQGFTLTRLTKELAVRDSGLLFRGFGTAPPPPLAAPAAPAPLYFPPAAPPLGPLPPFAFVWGIVGLG